MSERRSNERRSERRSYFLSAELSGAQNLRGERCDERRSKYFWAMKWASAQTKIIFFGLKSTKFTKILVKIVEQNTFNDIKWTKLAKRGAKINAICYLRKFELQNPRFFQLSADLSASFTSWARARAWALKLTKIWARAWAWALVVFWAWARAWANENLERPMLWEKLTKIIHVGTYIGLRLLCTLEYRK